MKALVYEGPERMELREVPVPDVGPGEVLIRVAYSGICGSELSGYLGHNSLRKPPMIFGHEFSGIIEKMDKAAEGTGLREGMRVTANPLITCGRCVYCEAGMASLCPDRKLLSAALPGSNAEFVAAPAAFVYPLEDRVSLRDGALTEPAACGIRVAELAAAGPGDTVLVAGMGPIGLFAMQAVLRQGTARVIATDLSEERLAYAAELGALAINPQERDPVEAVLALTHGRGVQAAIDAVGAASTRRQCAAAAASGGKVVFTGLHQAETTLDINDAVRRELKLLGSFAYSRRNFEDALASIAAGKMGLGDRTTVAALEDGPYWFDKLTRSPGKEIKILLNVGRLEGE
ncbi:zinc-binding dehydrogenase [Cohnella sp. GCM10012308]|uniref:zinc-dependent alcohol dehydrogenase n=1 Tax=Cohnella sp. GCM10012308 TaxID=3317329 RepID=UPI003611BA96